MTASTAAAFVFFVGVIGSVALVIIQYKTAGEEGRLPDRVFQHSLEALVALAAVGAGVWLFLR